MKLSGANLNYFIAVGAGILYFTIYVYVMGPENKITVTVLCNVSFIIIITVFLGDDIK